MNKEIVKLNCSECGIEFDKKRSTYLASIRKLMREFPCPACAAKRRSSWNFTGLYK